MYNKDPITDPELILLIKNSFEECLKHREFFHDFYDRFLKKDPRVAELFKTTDFERQTMALRGSLAYLIMFAEGSRIAENKVEELGIKHNRAHLNIAPDLYDLWFEALIETIEAHSHDFSEDHKLKWLQVLTFGITRMKSMH